MNIFAIQAVRQSVRNDITTLGELIDQEIAHLNDLKTQINALRQQNTDLTAFYNQQINLREREVQEAQLEVAEISQRPVPTIPSEPKPVRVNIDGYFQKDICSLEALNYWADSILNPLPIMNCNPISILNDHSKKPDPITFIFIVKKLPQVKEKYKIPVREYERNKSKYDEAVIARSMYDENSRAAALRLAQAQINQRNALTDRNNHITVSDQHIARLQASIRQVVTKIDALIKAESILRNRLIDTRAVTSIEVYDQIFLNFNHQLATLPIFQQLRDSRAFLQQKQVELLNRWTMPTLNGATALPIVVLGLAIYYLNPESVSLQKLIGLFVILVAVYKFSQPIQAGFSDLLNQVRGFNQIAQNIGFRLDRFLTNLEDVTDLTSTAAINSLNDMRGQTAGLINRADQHFTNFGTGFNFFRNQTVGAVRELGEHAIDAAETAAVTLTDGIREGLESIGDGIRAIANRIPGLPFL